jgi:hypothetical protein
MIGLMHVDGGPVQPLYTGDPAEGRPMPIWVKVDPRTGNVLFRDWLSIWMIDPSNRVPRQIVRFDDPARRSTRIEMDTDGENVFFSLGDPPSDLFVADFSPPGSN